METAADKKQIPCVARRHIKAAAFKTYDAMLATALAGQKKRVAEGKPAGSLVYSGSLADLGNKNDRSKEQEGEAIDELVSDGWLIPLQGKSAEQKTQRRNKRGGTWATCEYLVVTHEEHAKTHECPPLRYDENGNLIKRGRLAPGLRRANVRRLLSGVFAEDSFGNGLADMVAEAIEHKATDTGNPVAVQNQPVQEILCPPIQETLCPSDTGNPVATDTGNPVTRFASLSAEVLPATFASQPQSGDKGGQAGGPPSVPVPSIKPRWQEFIRKAQEEDLPDVMLYASPKVEEMEAVLKQLEMLGGDVKLLVEEIDDWVDAQSPPLHTLQYGRWARWLEQSEHIIQKAIEYIRWKEKCRR